MIWFEDLEAGYTTRIGPYRLERDEIVEFARHWDPYPFHTDEQAAADSVFGGLTASSCHLFAITTLLFHRDPDPIAVLAMLGKDEIRFPNPARPGDELTYRTECVEARASRSKPDRGLVTLADRLTNQRDETILSQRVTLMVARRPA
ncbi:MAG: MaoC/PaaZ C-terminal domain-containing protein [Myxococcota bacterium]